MTHGEAWYKNKQNLQEIETLDLEKEMDKIKLPPRMSHKEAVRYYNKKMFDYYVANLKAKSPMRVKKAFVSREMFGNCLQYKEFEEVKDEHTKFVCNKREI